MTDLAWHIETLPAGTAVDRDGDAYVCRKPDGEVVRFSLELGPNGPVVIKTIFPAGLAPTIGLISLSLDRAQSAHADREHRKEALSLPDSLEASQSDAVAQVR